MLICHLSKDIIVSPQKVKHPNNSESLKVCGEIPHVLVTFLHLQLAPAAHKPLDTYLSMLLQYEVEFSNGGLDIPFKYSSPQKGLVKHAPSVL